MEGGALDSQKLDVLVLGSAAGGGSPQWNCRCRVCRCVRRGASGTQRRTQASIAVSVGGDQNAGDQNDGDQNAGDKRWVLINASPDLRQQLGARRQMWPAQDGRHSPVSAVVLTGAEVDQVAGLLTLREGHRFSLYGAEATLEALGESAIFNALDPQLVPRRTLAIDQVLEPKDARGESLGLSIETFAVPGKVALYQETADQKAGNETPELDAQDGRNIGLKISAHGSDDALFYLPGCAAMTPELAERLRGAAAVMFDGTLWRDDELVRQELGQKTGRRMGHMSISGDDGTLAAFDDLGVNRRIFIHLNNTNPILLADSDERQAVERAGWEVAYDGMEFTL
jgi:pyrroloquinoline quinone biosynthesis protein B